MVAVTGAVNTVIKKEGRLIGDNTDWIGFYNLLRARPADLRTEQRARTRLTV